MPLNIADISNTIKMLSGRKFQTYETVGRLVMLKAAIREQTLDINLLKKSQYMHLFPLELF